jgi:general secretion pathway protein L
VRETLYMRLRSEPAEAPIEYALASAEGDRQLLVQRAPIDTVLDQATGRRIVVLVPGADVRLASVDVPARQSSKVLQAAPYLLEDQLADDVETLHFAAGPRQGDGMYPIAVVADKKMATWLQPFVTRGLVPDAMYPEMLALSWVAGASRWTGLAEPHQVTVRTGAYSGFCCSPEDLLDYLRLSDPERRYSLRLLLVGDEPQDYTTFDWPVELLPGHRSALQALVHELAPEQSINLLQGAYSPRENYKRLWLPWRPVAALAAIWLLLLGAYFIADNIRLGREISVLEQHNQARFRELFPSETRVDNVSLQLQQQMQLLRAAGGGGVFPLLETVASAMRETRGLTLTGLQFRDGALFLSMTGTDLQALEALREWFAKRPGVRLEVQSANAGAEGVQIRLRLTQA